MERQIKAIQTRYNGYWFRSRTEARWAVFFDSLGIPYEYEVEGFDLGISGQYLPDFHFPSGDGLFGIKWAEVKPYQGDYEIDVSVKFPKLHDFVLQVDDIVLLDGPPNFIWYCRGEKQPDFELMNCSPVTWGQDAMCYDIGAYEKRWFYWCGIERNDSSSHGFSKEYIKAINDSRSARFGT
jgi:hypothetical protein